MGVYKNENNIAVRYDGAPAAGGVAYDNTSSGLVSTNVQGAIDELNGNFDNKFIVTEFTGTTDVNGILSIDAHINTYGLPIVVSSIEPYIPILYCYYGYYRIKWVDASGNIVPNQSVTVQIYSILTLPVLSNN